MKTIKFYGKELVVTTFVVGGRMRVRAIHADGCWSFVFGQVDEDIAIPEWPIRVAAGHGYSARLEIDVPGDMAIVIREAKS